MFRPLRRDGLVQFGPVEHGSRPFARRSLIPDSVRASRNGDTTVVEIVLDEMPAGLRAGCEANLRQLVDVVHVGVMSIPSCGQDGIVTPRDQTQTFFR